MIGNAEQAGAAIARFGFGRLPEKFTKNGLVARNNDYLAFQPCP